MDLHHFFENMVRREETASAFLATLLDFDPVFRSAFLGKVTDGSGYANANWDVSVEEAHVDVTLDSKTARVIIENKIAAGAMQQDQLLGYYLRAVDEVPERRIVAVYLAPNNMGQVEVDRVVQDETFVKRRTDIASHLTWSDVAGIIDTLPDGPNAWFARSGKQQVERAIDRASKPRYPANESRALVREIAGRAETALAELRPATRFGRWSGLNVEQIFTFGAPVTLWLDAVFAVDPEPPYDPIGVMQEDGVQLVIRTQFKLAGKSRSQPRLRAAWDRLRSEGRADVPSVGVHLLRPDGWFAHEASVAGNEDDIASELARVGSAVLGFLGAAYDADVHPPGEAGDR